MGFFFLLHKQSMVLDPPFSKSCNMTNSIEKICLPSLPLLILDLYISICTFMTRATCSKLMEGYAVGLQFRLINTPPEMEVLEWYVNLLQRSLPLWGSCRKAWPHVICSQWLHLADGYLMNIHLKRISKAGEKCMNAYHLVVSDVWKKWRHCKRIT